MSEPITLKWRRHRLPVAERQTTHGGVGTLSNADVLTRAGLVRMAPAELEPTIYFPDLPDAPLDKALTLLRVASQIEHALMVQYLYAGYSFSDTQLTITGVAIEEMSHLMTVQNLLTCLGAGPYLQRQDFGASTSDDERLFPFDLRLEPLAHTSLAKYVVAESPAEAPSDVNPDVLKHITEVATGAAHEPINRVGVLYGLMAAVFGSQQLLEDLAADGDPWYVAVNSLAAEAADHYHGRDKLHLPDSAFDAASESRQGSDDDWDRSVVNDSLDEFRVFVVANRNKALEALRDIGLQGEGPSPVKSETSHFRRFYDLFVSFFGEDGMGTNPPDGVLDVPSGNRIVLDESGSGDNVISNPSTIQWARLADHRYAIMLASLERYLQGPSGDRKFLRGWCFAEMFATKTLAELLRLMPRGTAGATKVAALPFNLPGFLGTGAQWSDLVSAFDDSIAIAKGLRDGGGLDATQKSFLDRLLASDERKLIEATARAQGTTQSTRTDAVRDVLDWAAGAGSPFHSTHGRFWNLRNQDFVQVKIGGKNITTRPSSTEDAPLVARLRSGSMPADRPSLPPEGEEFLVVERWVNDGCPP